MKMTKNMRLEEAKRFARWIASNPSEWREMYSGFYSPMSEEVCLRYIEMMEREEFYMMIAIIISSNLDGAYMGNAIDSLTADCLAERIESGGVEKFLDDLKSAFKEEKNS